MIINGNFSIQFLDEVARVDSTLQLSSGEYEKEDEEGAYDG